MNAKEMKEKTQQVVEQYKENTKKVVADSAVFFRIVIRNKIQHAVENGEFQVTLNTHYLIDDGALKKYGPVINIEKLLVQEVREEFIPLGYEVSSNESLDQLTISWENA